MLDAVVAAERWLASVGLADHDSERVVRRLVELASHPKWEIRRAVANAASQSRHAAFEPVLVTLSEDGNARVTGAAERARARRLDWGAVSALGVSNETHLKKLLDNVEARHGTKAKTAVRKAAATLNSVFARQTYHEVVKILDPVAKSASRVRTLLAPHAHEELSAEVERLEARVARLHAFLEAMRAYAEVPPELAVHDLREVLDEAAALVAERRPLAPDGYVPVIEVNAERGIEIEIARSRVLQALTSVLQNAVEAYENTQTECHVTLSAAKGKGNVSIIVVDQGCGMTHAQVEQSKILFATNKSKGTGFGLPLAIQVVESEHEGRLEVRSEKGVGTTVTVTLPLRQQQKGSS